MTIVSSATMQNCLLAPYSVTTGISSTLQRWYQSSWCIVILHDETTLKIRPLGGGGLFVKTAAYWMLTGRMRRSLKSMGSVSAVACHSSPAKEFQLLDISKVPSRESKRSSWDPSKPTLSLPYPLLLSMKSIPLHPSIGTNPHSYTIMEVKGIGDDDVSLGSFFDTFWTQRHRYPGP